MNNKNIKSLFVPYEQALALKELGFNESCFGTWVGETLDLSLQVPSDDYFTLAPIFSQAFKLFREKYGLFSSFVEYSEEENFEGYYMYHITGGYNDDGFITYEEAELECLKKLIKITNEQQ